MEGEPSLCAAVASVKDARSRSLAGSLPSPSGDGGAAAASPLRSLPSPP